MAHKSVLTALYFVLVSSSIYIFRAHWAYDDPFITYRYAQNIAQGVGFVYNPAERVLSTTTPLFAILLSFVAPLLSHLPQAAILIGAISLAWGGLSLWKIGRAWNMPSVSWVGASLYPAFPLLLTTLGSEMPLCLAFCLAAIAAYAGHDYSLCAVWCALAVLSRPDSFLLVSVLTLDFLIHTFIRRSHTALHLAHTIFPVLVFAALTLPWFIFAWSYFGSPIPDTLLTKQHQASMEISTSFRAGFVNTARQYMKSGSPLHSAIVILETALAATGFISAWLAPRHWLAFLAWPVFHFLSYSLLRVSGYFWYYAPIVPGFLVAMGLGLSVLQNFSGYIVSKSPFKLRNPANHWKRISQQPVVTIVVCTVIFGSHLQTLWADRHISDSRVPIYQAIGTWLRDNTAPDARIGALEVGIIGYYAERYMIDFAGLLQPAVARQLQPGSTYEDAALWAIDSYQPDYVVLHRGLFPLLEQKLSRSCTPAQQFSGAAYQYAGDLDIYSCPGY